MEAVVVGTVEEVEGMVAAVEGMVAAEEEGEGAGVEVDMVVEEEGMEGVVVVVDMTQIRAAVGGNKQLTPSTSTTFPWIPRKRT